MTQETIAQIRKSIDTIEEIQKQIDYIAYALKHKKCLGVNNVPLSLSWSDSENYFSSKLFQYEGDRLAAIEKLRYLVNKNF